MVDSKLSFCLLETSLTVQPPKENGGRPGCLTKIPSGASILLSRRCVVMAARSKTPGTAAQRRTVLGQAEAAPPKPKARGRRSSAAKQAQPESTLAPPGQADQPQLPEASSGPIEQPPAAMGAAAGRELDASEAIKALSEMVAAGVNALAALREEVRAVNRRLDQIAAGRARPAAASDADDYSFGRDRDPGDAVPPGVAAATPAPLTETDEAVLHTLEDLPKRAGRGRRGPRAKA